MKKYTYGAMSSMYEVEADNKLTAYATMVMHYENSAPLIVIYSPEESKSDQWTAFHGKISERLDEVFGGANAFDDYVIHNIPAIRACYKSVKQLV
jgi:hypothetical protein